MTVSPVDIDGRRARRGRNREAVVDALLELFREGDLSPSVTAVAERSGVSLRSVFRYFDDLDEMGRIAIQRHLESVGSLFDLPSIGTGTRAQRIQRLVDTRIALYDAVAPIVRAAMLRAPFQPVLADGLQVRREFLRAQVEEQFATELKGLPTKERGAILDGADALTSFETLELLRSHRKMSVARTAASLTTSLDRLLP